MIRSIIYHNVNSDFLESCLCILRKLRLLQTGRVGQPVYGKLLSVLVCISVAVCILPSGFFQQLFCPFRIIGNCFHCFISIRKTVRKSGFGREPSPLHDHRAEALFINSHFNGFSYILILHDLRLKIKLSEKASACCAGINGILRISVKKRVVIILKTIGSLDIACLKGRGQSASVRKRLYCNFIHLYIAAPVIFIFYKINLSGGNFFCNIRTCSCHIGISPFSLNAIFHINNGSVGISQIVNDCRTWFCCVNSQSQSVCINIIDLHIRRSPVMNLYQIFQTFLYCLGIHSAAA